MADPCEEKPQSDTPRTDAADDVTIRFSERHARLRDLARQLERELAQAQHDLERAVANHAADLSAPSVTERFEPDDATRARVADIVSTNPLIASLLYDIDLLPEQIRDKRRYGYMLAVIDHMLVFASRVSATAKPASSEAVERDAARSVSHDLLNWRCERMNILCRLGLHRWRIERVLQKTNPIVGTRIFLDDDVCQRCERLRNPEYVADTYNMMVMTGPGKVVIHPSLRLNTRLHEE